jgi:hypothetical protein
MRTRRTLVLVAFAVLALLAASCGGDDTNSDTASTTPTGVPQQKLAITSPTAGARIAGNTVSLAINTSGITIVKADGDTSGKSGHFHVFVDVDPVAPGEAIGKTPQIVHSADNPIVIAGLSVGDHTLRVVYGDGAHVRLGNAQDSVKVHVDGPTLDATAPATLTAGQPLSIDVAVSGVSLVKADGDTTGKTGHLHAFVDVPPVAPGALIPSGNDAIIHSATSPIVIQGLAPGEHTIWIVLGDGTHTAFKDSVRDKIVVTVA